MIPGAGELFSDCVIHDPSTLMNDTPSSEVNRSCYNFELKKIHELEMKTGPKKAKKDSYIKDCKEQP